MDTLKLAGPVLFLSTLSLRRATSGHPETRRSCAISIHALLAESDCIIDIINNVINNFYPRSPCGERPTDIRQRLIEFGFLSTLSLRRATLVSARQVCLICHFYPRSPCGERLASNLKHTEPSRFLSTLSLRRATEYFLT